MPLLEAPHKETYSDKRLFKCTVPNCTRKKGFKFSSDLQRHKAVHSDKRPFKCTDLTCRGKRGYKTRSNLQNHKAVHSDKQLYKCTVPKCTRKEGFNFSGGLRRHMKIHSGERQIALDQEAQGPSLLSSQIPPQTPQYSSGAPQNYPQYSNYFGRRKALLIGINYFGQKKQQRGCINDVKNISIFLTTGFGYQRDEMVLLTDDQQYPMSQPTKQNILRSMHWLVKDAQPKDSLFFFYSGHTNDFDWDAEDRDDEVIYPVDFSQVGHIDRAEVHRIMVRQLQPGVRLAVIFDSLDTYGNFGSPRAAGDADLMPTWSGGSRNSSPAYAHGEQQKNGESTSGVNSSEPSDLSNYTEDFPATLTSIESSGSKYAPEAPSGRSKATANTNTFSCTYHGCTLRFETPVKLQQHTARDNQDGPHMCERINHSTGKPCNTIFSRAHDLTRHEGTIHNTRKQKLRCYLCPEDRWFTRNNALTRHLRAFHPDYIEEIKAKKLSRQEETCLSRC